MSNLQNFQQTTDSQIRSLLDSNASLVTLVSDYMGKEKFIESALQLLKDPNIASCTQESVFGCLYKAAMFGFRLSAELGHCWAVPRTVTVKDANGKNLLDQGGREVKAKVAVFQIGYKGWMELSFRSGLVESFDSGVVYEKDVFDFEQGSTPFLKFKPVRGNRGDRTHVWASATMKSGRIVFNVVPIEEIERHRKMSDTQVSWINNQKTVASSPVKIWLEHYDQMAKRIPTAYMCKLQLPKSELIQKAIEVDGGTFEIRNGEFVEVSPSQVEAQVEQTMELIDVENLSNRIADCWTAETLSALYSEKKEHADYAALFSARKQELITLKANGQI